MTVHKYLKIDWTRFTGYEVIAENRLSVIYPEFFRPPCRKNYALDRKMTDIFLVVSTSSITM